jgi:23S rRNA (uracil1939-C5)-methyltransferase
MVRAYFDEINRKGASVSSDGDVVTYGVFPGETADIDVLDSKRGTDYGLPSAIIDPDDARQEPFDDHYLSCSPWQVFPYKAQVQFKEDIVTDCLGISTEVVPADRTLRYRNKAEFSLVDDDGWTYAWHKRWCHDDYYPFDDCVLYTDTLHGVAQYVLQQLVEYGMAEAVKYVMYRQSFYDDTIHCTIFTTNEDPVTPNLEHDDLAGYAIVYSREESPATTYDDVVVERGATTLTEAVGDVRFDYHYRSFFQVNPAMFTRVIEDMRGHVEEEKVIDLYSGVGTIGLSLAAEATMVTGIELDPVSERFAKLNATMNDIETYEHHTGRVKRYVDHVLTLSSVVTIDPPRPGLHPDVIDALLEHRPKKILYLACNPRTQGRDVDALREAYDVTWTNAYDFYPQTPHVESLVVMERS